MPYASSLKHTGTVTLLPRSRHKVPVPVLRPDPLLQYTGTGPMCVNNFADPPIRAHGAVPGDFYSICREQVREHAPVAEATGQSTCTCSRLLCQATNQ